MDIPIDQLIHVLQNNMKNSSLSNNEEAEILLLLKTCLNKNYFQDQFDKQIRGLPISSIEVDMYGQLRIDH